MHSTAAAPSGLPTRRLASRSAVRSAAPEGETPRWACPRPAQILEQRQRAGRGRRRARQPLSSTNRTGAPGCSSAGGVRSRSHSGRSVRPISCQPPGPSPRVDARPLVGQPDRPGRHRGPRWAAAGHPQPVVLAVQVAEARARSRRTRPSRPARCAAATTSVGGQSAQLGHLGQVLAVVVDRDLHRSASSAPARSAGQVEQLAGAAGRQRPRRAAAARSARPGTISVTSSRSGSLPGPQQPEGLGQVPALQQHRRAPRTAAAAGSSAAPDEAPSRSRRRAARRGPLAPMATAPGESPWMHSDSATPARAACDRALGGHARRR